MANQEIVVRDEQQGLAVRHSQVTEVQRLGGLLAASGYFADAREMAQAAVKVLAGEELGIPPVASMMGINLIKGKIALSGNLIASRIRAHGYEYRHKQFDAKGCVLEFLGKPDAKGNRALLGESSFSEEDAVKAGVFSEMYKKYPRNMYFNRAISNGAKWYTPEVFAGAPVYVPEELGAAVDEQGDMIHPEPPDAQQQVVDRKLAAMKAGASYAEVSGPEQGPPEQHSITTESDPAAASIKVRLEQFAKIRAALGDPTYYQILGAHGFVHANEIKALSAAREIYREMKEALDYQTTRGSV